MSSEVDNGFFADEAEFASPRPELEYYSDRFSPEEPEFIPRPPPPPPLKAQCYEFTRSGNNRRYEPAHIIQASAPIRVERRRPNPALYSDFEPDVPRRRDIRARRTIPNVYENNVGIARAAPVVTFQPKRGDTKGAAGVDEYEWHGKKQMRREKRRRERDRGRYRERNRDYGSDSDVTSVYGRR
jgi:hypothetical protein